MQSYCTGLYSYIQMTQPKDLCKTILKRPHPNQIRLVIALSHRTKDTPKALNLYPWNITKARENKGENGKEFSITQPTSHSFKSQNRDQTTRDRSNEINSKSTI